MRATTADNQYIYQAFISYSHAADGELAPAIQKALSRFGTPWYRRSHTVICRDETGLGLTLDLWGEIQARLRQSKSFILLASPQAAQSEWVEKEIRFWLQYRPKDPFLIVVTAGEVSWRNDEMDFDWNHTTALPRSLEKIFQKEPLWANFRWAKPGANLSLGNPLFFVEIAKLVAGIREVPLEQVFDDADLQRKKMTRLLLAGATALVLLALTAFGAAYVSYQAKQIGDRLANDRKVELDKVAERLRKAEEAKRFQEQKKRIEAISARLAGQASIILPEDRELATRLALAAVNIDRTPEAENALRHTLMELVPPVLLQGHAGSVFSARFSSNGQTILTTSADATVRLWNAQTGTNVLTLWFTNDLRSGDTISAVLSSDGASVLTAVRPETLEVGYWDKGSVQLHDAATGKLLVSLPDRFVVAADLSPDGKQIVTGGFNAAVRIWDAANGNIAFELRGHDQRVSSVSFSSNGKWIATGSWDGTTRVWETATGKNLVVLSAPEQADLVTFNPDGSRILTVGKPENKEQKLRFWDWRSAPGSSLFLFAGHQAPIESSVFSTDGKWLATASIDRTARIWETFTGKGVRVLNGHEGPLTGVAFSPNCKWVVTVSEDRKARIWGTDTGDELIQLGWNHSPRTCVAFSPDGKHIATGTSDGTVAVYNYEICGSVDDLIALARARGTRQLSQTETKKYLQDL
jgi:WD40 repeat protein